MGSESGLQSTLPRLDKVPLSEEVPYYSQKIVRPTLEMVTPLLLLITTVVDSRIKIINMPFILAPCQILVGRLSR